MKEARPNQRVGIISTNIYINHWLSTRYCHSRNRVTQRKAQHGTDDVTN